MTQEQYRRKPLLAAVCLGAIAHNYIPLGWLVRRGDQYHVALGKTGCQELLLDNLGCRCRAVLMRRVDVNQFPEDVMCEVHVHRGWHRSGGGCHGRRRGGKTRDGDRGSSLYCWVHAGYRLPWESFEIIA